MKKIQLLELSVGAFMLAGILSLLMLALQVSGLSHFLREESGYKIHAEFSNIGGLKVRAKVSLAGVVVGRVDEIRLEPKTYNATVTMTIDPTLVTNLPSDSHASILTSGLLGDNYISLTPGFSETALKEGDMVSIDNTDSAMIIEQLISRFLVNQVGKTAKQGKKTP